MELFSIRIQRTFQLVSTNNTFRIKGSQGKTGKDGKTPQEG